MLVEYDKDDACIVRHSRATVKSLFVLTVNYTIPFVLACRGHRCQPKNMHISQHFNHRKRLLLTD
ncbi:hypothetical protein CPC08DRAFT_548015 [Agrocybe pediades]|nr:hypothetical protein CPC08DRAFT_548015 [Agrocybe pediades]